MSGSSFAWFAHNRLIPGSAVFTTRIARSFMSASLPEKDAPPVYVLHEMEVSFWRFDWPAFLRALETGQTNRRNANLDGHALNGSFENPATSQPFCPLQFSKRPFSAVANLLPA